MEIGITETPLYGIITLPHFTDATKKNILQLSNKMQNCMAITLL